MAILLNGIPSFGFAQPGTFLTIMNCTWVVNDTLFVLISTTGGQNVTNVTGGAGLVWTRVTDGTNAAFTGTAATVLDLWSTNLPAAAAGTSVTLTVTFTGNCTAMACFMPFHNIASGNPYKVAVSNSGGPAVPTVPVLKAISSQDIIFCSGGNTLTVSTPAGYAQLMGTNGATISGITQAGYLDTFGAISAGSATPPSPGTGTTNQMSVLEIVYLPGAAGTTFISNAPTTLSATAGVSSIGLAWTSGAVDGSHSQATTYYVYRSTGGPYALVGTTTNPTVSFTDNSAANNVWYAYYVTGVNAAGESVASNIVTARIVSAGGSLMESPTFLRGVQVGLEVTPGTAVAATKKIVCGTFDHTPMAPTKTAKGSGTKGAYGVQRGKRWTEWTMSGALGYNWPAYMGAGLISAAGKTPTTVGTTGKKYNYVMAESAPDTPQTFTIEYGNSLGENSKLPYSLFTDLQIKVNKDSCDFTLKGFSAFPVDSITMTASLPELAPILSSPIDFRLNYATTFAGLAAGKLTKVMDVEFNLATKWSSVFFVDDATTSFGGTLEMSPTITWKVTMEAGSESDAIFANLVNGDLIYLQLQGTGPLIETGTPNIYYLFQITTPVYVVKPDRGDFQNVFSGIYEFEGANDATNGNLIMTTVTTLTAL